MPKENPGDVSTSPGFFHRLRQQAYHFRHSSAEDFVRAHHERQLTMQNGHQRMNL